MLRNILRIAYGLVGGWPTPLKNISLLGLLFPIYGNIKNVPNHQPDMDDWNSANWVYTQFMPSSIEKVYGSTTEFKATLDISRR